MPSQRELDWDGCYNVRDLGGLSTVDGRTTRPGALIRADAPSGLTEAGWRAVRDYGVTTIVDLMETHERLPDAATRPAGLTEIHVPIDGRDDEDFWAPLLAERALGHRALRCAVSLPLPGSHRCGRTCVRRCAGRRRNGALRPRPRPYRPDLDGLVVAGRRGVADIVEDYRASDGDRVVALRGTRHARRHDRHRSDLPTGRDHVRRRDRRSRAIARSGVAATPRRSRPLRDGSSAPTSRSVTGRRFSNACRGASIRRSCSTTTNE